MSEGNASSVVKIVQELLLGEDSKAAITPSVISGKIDLVLAMNRRWADGLDRDKVIDELIRRFSMWIGEDTSLVDQIGHVPWLDAARKKDWRYWLRYSDFLELKLSWKAVDALDKSTDKIMGMLEDPQRPGTWSRRGLVVGHVQSGKTANYTGLVCKAADAQYKVIVVLAGLHNNLRSQTQIRLEEGFLGFETDIAGNVQRRIGVGLVDTDQDIKPNCATTRANNGDFGGRAATQLSISPEERPWLFVVKKNKSVLVQLLKWIQNHVADTPMAPDETEGDRQDPLPRVTRRVTKLPLLIIDDEADNASVDTGEMELDAEGKPDDEHQPKTINRLIRRILHSFSRSAYVGYTATPFANIFIHERGETKSEGLDLFPSAFIQNLATPSNYIGPERIFGRPVPGGRAEGLPLTRDANDFGPVDGSVGWMPARHKPHHVPVYSKTHPLPPSLYDALHSFVLACCVRVLRGQGAEHCSMLVHVTRFVAVQGAVHRQVDEYVQTLRQHVSRGIGHEAVLDAMRGLWESDFLPTFRKFREAADEAAPASDPAWSDVVSVIADVVNDIDVRMINGSAKDVLDYEESRSTGLKVIAIGGEKLSRGLTLEGLCTSYFLRASKMYDTLMQMGRWFGYRPGYLDLCRLYTSPDLVRWFRHISDAASELREEFDLMVSSGATPRDFGLKVQAHPELLVTSQLKMRNAKTLRLSFCGQLMQTVALPRDQKTIQQNFDAAANLVQSLGRPHETGIRRRFGTFGKEWNGHLWRDVHYDDVVDFLQEYKTMDAAHRVNSTRLAEFIYAMANPEVGQDELTTWTVALLGIGDGTACELSPGISVNMVKRTSDKGFDDRYSIGVLLDPRDEWIDLSESQWQAALDLTAEIWRKAGKLGEPEIPSGPAIRRVRGMGAPGVAARADHGLLILYVLNPAEAELGFDADTAGVVGFGISFPGSDSRVTVSYTINNVAWELEYGPSE